MILEGAYRLPGRAAREAARLLVNESGEGVTLQRQDEQRLYPLGGHHRLCCVGQYSADADFQRRRALCAG